MGEKTNGNGDGATKTPTGDIQREKERKKERSAFDRLADKMIEKIDAIYPAGLKGAPAPLGAPYEQPICLPGNLTVDGFSFACRKGMDKAEYFRLVAKVALDLNVPVTIRVEDENGKMYLFRPETIMECFTAKGFDA